MPSFSRPLEETLHRAVSYANERRHEYATLEHLLLALIDDIDASGVMKACNVDLVALKTALTLYVDTDLAALATSDGEDAKPTAGFQRVIQRAVIHVQSSGREEVSGANVLVAIFSERESHAAYFLQEQDMTRYDAVNYIAHGIAKKAGMSEQRPAKTAGQSPEEAEDAAAVKSGGEALEAYCVDLNEKSRKGKIDPLIGRHAEVDRAIQILCRRTKNNPLYVGEPGVGKTAIAEGLAWRITQKDVPEILACDLQSELGAQATIKAGMAHCETVRDYVSRDLLGSILEDTEAHIDFLETQIDLIAKIGLPNYLQSQMGELA